MQTEKVNRFYYILLSLIFSFYGCKRPIKPVRLLFDYSYSSGWAYSFSIKVYSDGNAYLRKNNLRSDSLYVKQKVNIDNLYTYISNVIDGNIASKYEDTHLQDAPSFNFIIYLNAGKISKHYVSGNRYPVLLRKIKDYAKALSEEKGWHHLKDTSINFSSMANLNYVPKIRDTTTHFLPPNI